MNEECYIKGIKKVNGKRHRDVKNKRGVKDAYYWSKKNIKDFPKIRLATYRNVVTRINQLLSERLLCGDNIYLPCQMGDIYILKCNNCNHPIDWNKTLKFWYSDKTAEEEKFLVRDYNTMIYKVIWDKKKSKFVNKGYFRFILNRTVKNILKQKIKDGLFDSIYSN